MRPTILNISLPTLVHNAEILRAAVPATTKMLCVVKADAYGHGAVPFALGLEKRGLADAFAVAIVEEAEELRAAGVKSMIVILGGAAEQSVREAVRCEASQACYDVHTLSVLRDEAVKCGKRAKAHLKLDTGMTRIGVRTDEELKELLAVWKNTPEVEMEGCFTHFCVAETDPDFTAAQDARFCAMVQKVKEAGFAPICHAAASSAMLDPRYQHDMVRAGIALYGSCMPQLPALKNAQTLTTRPIRIETVEAGATIGYGRTYTATRKTRIMTIPIGYGDGYPRILSNSAPALLHGQRVKNVGRVCMDMLMLDVTDVENVSLDDEVVLLGTQGEACITPDELADLSQTIPYEIMLGFLPRIPHKVHDS